MQELIINEELRTLLPPLSDEEFAGLEADILEHKCLSPLITWNNILIDGHHRYKICKKHEIPFSIQNIVFENIDAAKLWAWKHQENRRNLTPFHRAEIALKLKETISAKAKERQGVRTDLNVADIVENSPQCKRTRQELAEVAGVSDNTIAKVEYITEHADDETKKKLRQGEKGTSINKEYHRLRDEEKKETPQSVEEDSDNDTCSEPPCPNKDRTSSPKTTLKLIPQDSPQVLLANLFDHFRKGFVEEMVPMAMDMLWEQRGHDVVKIILSELNKKFARKK